MYRYTLWFLVVPLMLFCSSMTHAEARRDGGGDQASRKAQYMIRQLHNEKQALQAKLAETEAKYDQLVREHEKTRASLEKSSTNNDQLMSRVKNNIKQYKDLAEKYREAVSILRKANLDNQYMVRAVQEREQWISDCSVRNEELFEANTDLLQKYGEVASEDKNPFTGIGIVTVENEVQEYRFKLEDLQVTKFKPSVDTESHARDPNETPVDDDGDS